MPVVMSVFIGEVQAMTRIVAGRHLAREGNGHDFHDRRYLEKS